MGETDEIVPQSLPVEDETGQEPAADEPVAASAADEPVPVPAVDEPVADEDISGETDELADISQSLADEDVAADAADSFDAIAPPVASDVAVSSEPEQTVVASQVPWWPFLIYLGAWVALAVAAVWQLLQLPVGQAVYESPAYAMTILGGLIMTAMGPLLIVAAWLGTRANRSAQEREGLLTSALMKGALVTLCGALIWWASLVIIDYLRLGRLL